MSNNIYNRIESIRKKDDRYEADAYMFVLAALNFTLDQEKREGHLTGKELLLGIKDLGLKQYGRMTRAVFEHWGVTTTDDFGNIVFNMIEARVLGRNDTDKIEDFKNVYDFKTVFEDDYLY